MCVLCDGVSEGEFSRDMRVRIERHGFTLVSVHGDPFCWTYTIGLIENFDHPEFVVTGLHPGDVNQIITALVARIREGERFDAAAPDDVIDGLPVRFGDVHYTQWNEGRFAMWANHYGTQGFIPGEPAAVQILWANGAGVFPPNRDFCRQHPECQPLLAVAAARDVNVS